jgi:flagellin
MIINTNIASQTAATNLAGSTSMLNKALAELSSGSKITSPADDAAGLAESINLSADINRDSAASTNVTNAISFAQTQDGFLQNVGNALNRMSQLSVQAQDVTKSATDRGDYQSEFATLAAYVGSAANQTFNGVSLFTATALSVTTDGDGGSFTMSAINLSATAYTAISGGALNISTSAGAVTALTAVQTAITQLSTDRGTVGANESRLNYSSAQLSTLSNNLSAANSAIVDVDVAQESTQFAKYQILVQAGTSMLAQANALPQSVLKLLS